MIRLAYDARWLTTGLGTYTWNLLTRLKVQGPVWVRAYTGAKNSDRIAPYCDEVRIINAPMYSLKEQWVVPAATRGATVVHATHYNAPLLCPGKLVVSIHDLNHILDATFRRTWKSRLYARPMFSCVAARASHILTVSEYSKRQMVEHLGVAPAKVTVTSCGVAPEFFSALPAPSYDYIVRRECGVSRPYLLYVGNLRPHKNVAGLLRAFAAARQREARDCQLLIIGDDRRGGHELRQLASKLGLNGSLKLVPHVSEQTLRAAYRAAEMTVLPSFEEGFGLPVVESMASGTPVACSAKASLPEVGGAAAQYFDPTSDDSIASAIEKVLSDSELRMRMRSEGLQQARRFTWESCAEKAFSVYQTVSAESTLG